MSSDEGLFSFYDVLDDSDKVDVVIAVKNIDGQDSKAFAQAFVDGSDSPFKKLRKIAFSKTLAGDAGNWDLLTWNEVTLDGKIGYVRFTGLWPK